ncbi:SCO family protein [Roseomonas sp. SSH11]|uniref:SCO family protein n=1 Tax=Pararoseomonas baculiformis TaxID=2820812 RepID=A0ABS4AC14_9PROT|nr:SCO family protein [Pararoseomonas baculiformis]MBP0444552.1 SCO family protein [Pararoseomonas baculiformis]
MPGRRGLFSLAAACAMPRLVRAHDAHDPAPRPASSEAVIRLRSPLPDVRVTDAQRRRRRLVSEVFAGRVVAIDFVLTDCASFCTVISAAMAGAQEMLGPRLSREVGLVSLALDPIGGTPDELKAYAHRFSAGPGWDFVNIPPAPLDNVLRGIGGPVSGGDHTPMVLVLDTARGEIRRILGIPEPEAIVRTIDAALSARRAQA